MGAKPKSAAGGEDGHDAIVRRLLAAQAGPANVAPAKPAGPTRTPAELLSAARRFSGDVLPGLEAFGGGAIDWTVRQVRPGTWDDAAELALASPLTRVLDEEPRLTALVTCDEGFLAVLMASLFGTVTQRRREPTAAELMIFAQLVVRLRDGMDAALDHGPPERPADCMRLFAPDDPNPLIVEIDVVWGDAEGRLCVVLTHEASARFLPAAPAAPRPFTGMNRLPLAAEIRLAGPRLALGDIAALAVGRTFPVGRDARLYVAGRSVATGRLDRDANARTLSLDPTTAKETHDG